MTLRVRTPGGDIPIQRADLRDAVAMLNGKTAAIQDVVFKEGLHGCTVRFHVSGEGTLVLSGHLDLINPDGTAWTSLELPKEVKPAGRFPPPRSH